MIHRRASSMPQGNLIRMIRLIHRETGLALAVLALWLLALLAPLHQTSGLLHVMASAGVATSSGWTICESLDQGESSGEHAVPVCPAQGIGKSDLHLAAPAKVAPQRMVLSATASLPSFTAHRPFEPQLHPLQPRAPPTVI